MHHASRDEPVPQRRSSVVRLHVPFAGDDAALVRAVREGNASAKAELFHRYAPQLERLITHLLGYDAELADILQETFVGALRSLGSLKDPAALKPWLFTIATLTARKTLRSRARRRWLRFFSDEAEESRHEPQVDPPSEESRSAARAVYAICKRSEQPPLEPWRRLPPSAPTRSRRRGESSCKDRNRGHPDPVGIGVWYSRPWLCWCSLCRECSARSPC